MPDSRWLKGISAHGVDAQEIHLQTDVFSRKKLGDEKQMAAMKSPNIDAINAESSLRRNSEIDPIVFI